MMHANRPEAVQCAAIFDDPSSATTYNLRPRVRVYASKKQCERKAVEDRFCKTHARLDAEGMIDGDQVLDANTRREKRRAEDYDRERKRRLRRRP